MEKNYVQIHSKKTIQVTAGLQFSDYTDVTQPTPNRKNVKPRWTKGICMIKEGQHWYPYVVSTWKTTKALEEAGVITIGQVAEKCDDEKVVEEKKQLDKDLKVIKDTSTAEVKVKRLNTIAEQEN